MAGCTAVRTPKRAYRYKDAARKYLQHFMYICDAMNRIADDGLWDEKQGFFMDCANQFGRLQVFSMVGLVPLFAIEEIAQTGRGHPESFYDLYGFLRWFAATGAISSPTTPTSTSTS